MIKNNAPKFKNNHNNIAIVGMACKFPGANDPSEFWDLLKNGKETISSFTSEQLRTNGVGEELLNDDLYVPYRGVLDNIFTFDSKLFKLSDADLKSLNIPARIFMQLTWQALEDAGIAPQSCPKNTAVFLGANDTPLTVSTGGVSSMLSIDGIKELHYTKSLSTLIAYHFGLQGTAVNVHTACSTSLVALINACHDLILGNSDLAITGGVAIDTPQEVGYLYEETGIFSIDGHCRAFDEKASGAVLSNGSGVLILKRLNDAIADRDNIHAIICGFATNNDGNLKPGFLAPGINGQYGCIKKALEKAAVNAADIDYIEAHGAATLIGDPIEFFALNKVFSQDKANFKNKKCGIGSVKTNIGHTTLASGMAGTIKTVLMLKNRAWVPSLHFKKINPNINIENSPFFITTDYKKFPKKQKDIYAGVSNFGLGGTNAHIVLKNSHPQPSKKRVINRRHQILTFSATNNNSLIQLIHKYIKHYGKIKLTKSELANVSFTGNCGRSPLNCRTYFIYSNYKSFINELSKASLTPIQDSKKAKVIFIFSGEQPNFKAFCLNLYKEEYNFAKIIDFCVSQLSPRKRNKIKPSLFNINDKNTKNSVTRVIQFILSYSLAKYFYQLGIIPSAIVANGFGEFTAAALTGMLEVKEILSILGRDNFTVVNNKERTNQINFKKVNLPFFSLTSLKWLDKNHNISFSTWLSQIQDLALLPSEIVMPAGLAEESKILLGIGSSCSWEISNEAVYSCNLPFNNQTTDSYSLVKFFGELWSYGINISWDEYYQCEQHYKLSLPTYCFTETFDEAIPR